MSKDKAQPTWKTFEAATKAVLSRFTPKAEVEHDVKLEDRQGIRRQFDVVVRDTLGPMKILAVIECKDLRGKVGIEIVDAFISKSKSVNANIAVIVSRRGFTQPAIDKAAYNGLGLFSLLDGSIPEIGFQSYASIYSITDVNMKLQSPQIISSDPIDFNSDCLLNGIPLVYWCYKSFKDQYIQELLETPYEWIRGFSRPKFVKLGGEYIEITRVRVAMEFVREVRTKFQTLTGPGVIDWGSNSLVMPTNEWFSVMSFDAGFSDWDEFTGEIPEHENIPFGVMARLNVFRAPPGYKEPNYNLDD